MNRSAKKQLHEKNRKRHKHELQEHAREAARRERSKTPLWFLVLGICAIIVVVAVISLR
jgi:hypothetical protein